MRFISPRTCENSFCRWARSEFVRESEAAATAISRVGDELLTQLQRVGASLPTHISIDPVVVRVETAPAYYESGN